MARLRARRLCDLLLGPVAQVSRPARLRADLGLAGRRASSPSPSAASRSSPMRPASGSPSMSRSISTAAARRPARYFAGLTAKAEVGLIIGTDRGDLGRDRRDPGRLYFRSVAAARTRTAGSISTCSRCCCRSRSSPSCSPPTASPPSTGSTRSPTCSPRPGSARRWRRCRTWCCRGCGRRRARPTSSARRWSASRSAPISPARCRC